MNFKRLWEKMEKSKGYYIALILCAAAIGITGYVYQKNTAKTVKRNSAEVQIRVEDEQAVAVMDTTPAVTNATAPSVTAEPSATPKEPMKTAAPVSGELISEYAMDCLSYNETTRDWRVHNGVDIAAETGTDVHAAADGVVYTIYEDDMMGTTVVIRHEDGYVTKYSSLAEELPISVGDHVTLGQTIGTVDNTALLENAIGSHLHFSVVCNDEQVDPGSFCDLG